MSISCLTLGVQQSGDAQFSLRHAEGLLQILLVALSVHLVHVNQSGPANGNQPENYSLLSIKIKTTCGS